MEKGADGKLAAIANTRFPVFIIFEHLSTADEKSFALLIKELNRATTHRIEGLSSTTTIQELKEKVKAQVNLANLGKRWCLIHQGKKLQDDFQLRDYGITQETTVYLGLKTISPEKRKGIPYKKALAWVLGLGAVGVGGWFFLSAKKGVKERTSKKNRRAASRKRGDGAI